MESTWEQFPCKYLWYHAINLCNEFEIDIFIITTTFSKGQYVNLGSVGQEISSTLS